MPTKFRKDSIEWVGEWRNKQPKVMRSYIKNTPEKELFEYINNANGKAKIKQKCRNELTRRGVKIIKVPQAETTQWFDKLK
tara:strand:+ start:470 stop:712 length:243 start_codon:yes stop_codon:yes gene_type:complete